MLNGQRCWPRKEVALIIDIPRNPAAVIVNPPFSSPAWPVIGPSILKAACAKLSMEVCVYYANLLLWSRLGDKVYDLLFSVNDSPMIGELMFAAFAFHDDPIDRTKSKLRERFKRMNRDYIQLLGFQPQRVYEDEIISAVDHIDRFLREISEAIVESCTRVVGLSSVFQQQTASIAIARAVKQRAPGVITIIGGSNVDSPMADAWAQSITPIDYYVTGEADDVFPPLLQRLQSEPPPPTPHVIDCPPVRSMSTVSSPDYSDYFAILARHDLKFNEVKLPHYLHFESSRGCWWGEKHHCTFCGLNGHGMQYRARPTEAIISELRDLEDRYGVTHFQATDNILPLTVHNDVLKRLATIKRQWSFFYSVKSNLKPSELDVFVAAGIKKIQPGIESLSTPTLKLMKKGVSGPSNVALLRDCLDRGIYPYWNYLYGFPGENDAHLEEVIRIIPAISHLFPPQGIGRIWIDRFSPYFMNPGEYGIDNLVPNPGYLDVYGDVIPNLSDIAYHFIWKREGEEIRPAVAKPLEEWKRSWADGDWPVLKVIYSSGQAATIEDTRSIATDRYFVPSEAEIELLERYHKPASVKTLATDRASAMQNLIDRNLIICYEDIYLTVVLGIVGLSQSKPGAEPARSPFLTEHS